METTCNTADVVVVGGGVSGLSAAQALANAGFKVIILEARDHVGGRLHSVRLTSDNEAPTVDVGASWLHKGDSATHPINILAKSLNLAVCETDWEDMVAFDESGRYPAMSKFPPINSPLPSSTQDRRRRH